MSRLTKEQINKELKEHCGEGHLVQMMEDEEYKNSKEKNWYKCECGWEYKTTRDRVRHEIRNNNKYRCPVLRDTKAWNYKMLVKKFKKEKCELLTDENDLIYNKSGIKIKQYIDFKCSCGKTDNKTIDNFIQTPYCQECGYENIRKGKRYSYDFIVKTIAKDGYELLTTRDEYINSRQSLEVICDRGHRTQIIFNNYLNKDRRCRFCSYEDHSGEGHPLWDYNLSYEDRIEMRDHPDYKEWRKSVFERDNYVCQISGIKGHKIAAHHIYSFNKYKDLRLEVSNGITLNKNIHKLFHNIYGYGDNSEEQFEEFKERYYKGEFDDKLNNKLQAY